jgi:Ca2+-binding EF-hand superfamily protein
MAAGTPALAVEQHPVDTPVRLLERMDRDLDGKISFEEYRNAMLRRFDANDKNGDGVLDASEYPREWVAGAETQAANGQVTWDEFGAALQPTFDRFDADHDGKLDSSEIAALAAARQANEGAKP